MTIEDRIRLVAKTLFDSNISELARSCGINQGTIGNIVSGRRSEPSFSVLVAIAIKLNINLNWLVLEEGEMFRGEVSGSCQECLKKEMELRILNEQISAKNTLLEEKDKRLREKDDYIELIKCNISGLGKLGS